VIEPLMRFAMLMAGFRFVSFLPQRKASMALRRLLRLS